MTDWTMRNMTPKQLGDFGWWLNAGVMERSSKPLAFWPTAEQDADLRAALGFSGKPQPQEPVQQPVQPPVQTEPVRVPEPVVGRVVDMGPVGFNGQPTWSHGFGYGDTAVATLIVPDHPSSNPSTIAVYEVGTTNVSRRAWLSKVRFDCGATKRPWYVADTGPVFNYQIGGSGADGVLVMQPGEIWYLMVRNELDLSFFGDGVKPSLDPGQIADIGVKWYPAS